MLRNIMMVKEQVWTEFSELPPGAQAQVMEFIAFLHTRYHSKNSPDITLPSRWCDEPFVGMWKEREEMRDSNAWVRTLRDRERNF